MQTETYSRKKLVLMLVAAVVIFGIAVGLFVANNFIEEPDPDVNIDVFDGNQLRVDKVVIPNFYEQTILAGASGEDLDKVYISLQTYFTHAYPEFEDLSVDFSSLRVSEGGAYVNLVSSAGEVFSLNLLSEDGGVKVKLARREQEIFSFDTQNYVDILR